MLMVIYKGTQQSNNRNFQIVQALNQAFEKRTVVVVAHRLSTIMNADQIVVLKDGMIIEVSNHEKLMEKRSHYFELVDKQMGVWSVNSKGNKEVVNHQLTVQ